MRLSIARTRTALFIAAAAATVLSTSSYQPAPGRHGPPPPSLRAERL